LLFAVGTAEEKMWLSFTTDMVIAALAGFFAVRGAKW
jgi:hypothetical protein